MKEHSDSKTKYSEDDIIKILEYLVANMFVVCLSVIIFIDGVSTNCAPLLADIFLYSYEEKFIVFVLNGKKTVGISVQFHIRRNRKGSESILMINALIPSEKKAKGQHKEATKTSITQRLRTSLGRSVWVNAVIELVCWNR